MTCKCYDQRPNGLPGNDMGTGISTQGSRDTARTQRTHHRHHAQRQPQALVNGAQQAAKIGKHDQFRSSHAPRTEPGWSLTRRVILGQNELPMLPINFGVAEVKEGRNETKCRIPVLGEPAPRLMKLVEKVIVAVLRLNYPDQPIHAEQDRASSNRFYLKTGPWLRWNRQIRPCLDDAKRAFDALRAICLTENQFAALVDALGDVRSPEKEGVLPELLHPTDRRIGFVREGKHARIKTYAEPDNAMITNLAAWAVKLQKIGAYDTIFALLDKLDLSMMGEFHDLSERPLPHWQKTVIDCYLLLTRVSFEELEQRGWINFDDLIADLKTDLIIGLCSEQSGYCDPVMAAKVMLRQARANSYSGELAAGDLVIEALVAAWIPIEDLADAIGRLGPDDGSEALWWDKLERRRLEPQPKNWDEAVNRAKRTKRTGKSALPRFSLDTIGAKWRVVRVHNVTPDSPINSEITYMLQGLVEAVFPGSLTEVGASRSGGTLRVSFSDGDAEQMFKAATLYAESMFQSFVNFGITEEQIAGYFAMHRMAGTTELFSHGVAKLFATPRSSHFGIVVFPDKYEFVDYDSVKNDEQRLDRALHLSETIEDLALHFNRVDAAKTLIPVLRSDLRTLWYKTAEKPLDWDRLKFSELRSALRFLLGARSAPPPLQEDDEPPLPQHRWRWPGDSLT